MNFTQVLRLGKGGKGKVKDSLGFYFVSFGEVTMIECASVSRMVFWQALFRVIQGIES